MNGLRSLGKRKPGSRGAEKGKICNFTKGKGLIPGKKSHAGNPHIKKWKVNS